jgi:IS4 transposase
VVETDDLSSWLAKEMLAALPDALVLREGRYRIGTLGFRTRQVTLETTLLNAALYRVADLAELYRQRWQVEISQPHYGSREHLSLAAA